MIKVKIHLIFSKTYVLFKELRKSYIFRVSSKKEVSKRKAHCSYLYLELAVNGISGDILFRDCF